MEKQKQQDLKEYLIQIVSKNTGIDETTCYRTIDWVYKKAKEKAKTTPSLEISGFGSFLFFNRKLSLNIKKKEDMLEALNKKKETTSHIKTMPIEDIIENVKKDLEYLKKVKEENEQTKRMDGTSTKRVEESL